MFASTAVLFSGAQGEYGNQQPLFKVLVEKRNIGKTGAAAVNALNNVELLLQNGFSGLRRPRNIHPGDDLCFKVPVAPTAAKRFTAIGPCIINKKGRHGGNKNSFRQ